MFQLIYALTQTAVEMFANAKVFRQECAKNSVDRLKLVCAQMTITDGILQPDLVVAAAHRQQIQNRKRNKLDNIFANDNLRFVLHSAICSGVSTII